MSATCADTRTSRTIRIWISDFRFRTDTMRPASSTVIDIGRFTTQLYGGDATIRWKPLQRSVYHSFVGRSEFVWSNRDQPDGTQNAKGYFVSADYQLARRWYMGGRYDHTGRPDAASVMDSGQSADPFLFSKRVQSDSRPIPADRLRRRAHCQRISLSIPICNRGAWRAPVLSARGDYEDEIMSSVS